MTDPSSTTQTVTVPREVLAAQLEDRARRFETLSSVLSGQILAAEIRHIRLDVLALSAAPETQSEMARLRTENARLREAVAPFAAAGRAIEGRFGAALFPDDDIAFGRGDRGCSWTENGETKILTWGDLRRAARALTTKEG